MFVQGDSLTEKFSNFLIKLNSEEENFFNFIETIYWNIIKDC